MFFKEISPFVRYARYMPLQTEVQYIHCVPYDARLFYAQKGKSTIVADGVEYQMKPGAVLVINPGVEYQIFPDSDNDCYIAMNFDYTREFENIKTPIPPARVSLYDEKLLMKAPIFEDAPEMNKVFYATDITEIEKKLKTLVREYNVKLIHHEIKTSALLSQCLAECVRKQQGGMVLKDVSVSMDIIEYIHNNLGEKITNIQIGKLFGYHPNYISNIIKQSTGMPLHKYILHTRLMKALELLEDRNYSVGEVAQMCGFCDIGYFSAYFKKAFGTSPSEYRG